jgi:hypothetical protein
MNVRIREVIVHVNLHVLAFVWQIRVSFYCACGSGPCAHVRWRLQLVVM